MNQTRNCCDMGKQRLLGDGICEGIQGAEVKTLKQDLDKIWADSYRKTFFSKPNTELLSNSTTNLKSLPRPPCTTSAEVIRIPCATDYESSASEAEEEEEATQRINTDTTTTEHTDRKTMRNPSEKTTITNFQSDDDDWPPEGVDRRTYLIQQSFAKATDHFLQITVPKQLQMRQSYARKKSAGSKAPDKNVPSEDITNTQTDNNVVYKFRYSNASEGSIYSHRFDDREFRVTK